MATDWTMPRRADACCGCQREFAIGEYFHAVLGESPAGYERRDYCEPCRPADIHATLAHWRTRRNAPQAGRPTLVLDREMLQALLDRLDGAADPARLQLRFLIALVLWRKRALRFVAARPTDNGETWEFARPRDGGALHIARPPIDEAEMERLSADLEGLLSGAADLIAEVAGPVAGAETTDA